MGRYRSGVGICQWRTAACLGAIWAGCGGGPLPTIAITNPTPGALVVLGSDLNASVAVAYATTHFTVQAPGTCGGAGDCGQVHLLIDGPACDPVGLTYNNLAVSSPATAHFAACATPAGAHTVSLQLFQDDGAPVRDAHGGTVSASVAFVTQ